MTHQSNYKLLFFVFAHEKVRNTLRLLTKFPFIPRSISGFCSGPLIYMLIPIPIRVERSLVGWSIGWQSRTRLKWLNTHTKTILFGNSYYCSVTQFCPTLCDSTDSSTPEFPVVLQYLPEFAQTHVHHVGDTTISSSVIPFFSHLQSLPASWSFPMSQFFASGGQSIGTSASVLPKNIQDWSPLGLTG